MFYGCRISLVSIRILISIFKKFPSVSYFIFGFFNFLNYFFGSPSSMLGLSAYIWPSLVFHS